MATILLDQYQQQPLWADEFDACKKDIFSFKTDIDAQVLRAHSVAQVEVQAQAQGCIEDICRDTFGESPCRVVPLKPGACHVLFQVGLPDHCQYIIKFRIFPVQHRAFEFLNEHWVAQYRSEGGFKSPEVIRVDVSRKLCGWDYQILELLSGIGLKDIEDDASQFIDGDILFKVGQSLAHIHQVQGQCFGFPKVVALLNSGFQGMVGNHASWESYLRTRLDEHIAVCYDNQAIDRQEAGYIERLFADFQYPQSRASILHGDLGNHNIVILKNNEIGFLDWEDMIVGDPVYDLAYWGTFMRDDQISGLLKGYVVQKALPDNVEVCYWVYYLRIALAKTVYRLRLGVPQRPDRPPASLRIQKAIKHIKGMAEVRV